VILSYLALFQDDCFGPIATVIQLAENSSIKAMTINGFLLARLEMKRCLIKPERMVVMGGLQMTLSLRVCVAGT